MNTQTGCRSACTGNSPTQAAHPSCKVPSTCRCNCTSISSARESAFSSALRFDGVDAEIPRTISTWDLRDWRSPNARERVVAVLASWRPTSAAREDGPVDTLGDEGSETATTSSYRYTLEPRPTGRQASYHTNRRRFPFSRRLVKLPPPRARQRQAQHLPPRRRRCMEALARTPSVGNMWRPRAWHELPRATSYHERRTRQEPPPATRMSMSATGYRTSEGRRSRRTASEPSVYTQERGQRKRSSARTARVASERGRRDRPQLDVATVLAGSRSAVPGCMGRSGYARRGTRGDHRCVCRGLDDDEKVRAGEAANEAVNGAAEGT